MNIITRAQLSGFFKLVKHKADHNGNVIPGTAVVVADWFPNIITNGGLNAYAGSTDYYLSASRVGTGSAVPAATDTSLASQVGSRVYGGTAGESTVSGESGISPYYGFIRRTWRYAVGAAAGNLAEVGVATAATTGILFSRALILDELGNPTTITVLSDEVLDVTYELRLYPSVADVIGSVVLDGVTHNTVLRAAEVDGGTIINLSSIWVPAAVTPNSPNEGTVSIAYGPDAVLGAVTSVPTASTSLQYTSGTGNNLQTMQPYTVDTFYRDVVSTFGLTRGNIEGGIKAILMARDQSFAWQMSFDPVIPKTDTKVLTITNRTYFARRP